MPVVSVVFTHSLSEGIRSDGQEARDQVEDQEVLRGQEVDPGDQGNAQRHQRPPAPDRRQDRKSVVEGKSVSVRVDLGGRRIIKQKTIVTNNTTHITPTKRT